MDGIIVLYNVLKHHHEIDTPLKCNIFDVKLFRNNNIMILSKSYLNLLQNIRNGWISRSLKHNPKVAAVNKQDTNWVHIHNSIIHCTTKHELQQNKLRANLL